MEDVTEMVVPMLPLYFSPLEHLFPDPHCCRSCFAVAGPALENYHVGKERLCDLPCPADLKERGKGANPAPCLKLTYWEIKFKEKPSGGRGKGQLILSFHVAGERGPLAIIYYHRYFGFI